MSDTNRYFFRGSFLVFLCFFAVFALLRQGCFYKHDGWAFLEGLQGSVWESHTHYLYLPFGKLFTVIGSWIGLDGFTAAGLYSGFGAAAGLAFHYPSLRLLGLKRSDALLVTLLAGFSAPVLFFATVIEIHGPFLAFAGIAFLATASLVERPSYRRAVLLGLAIALARGVHASGILLVVVFLPWFLVRVRMGLRAALPLALTAALCAAAGVLLLGALVPLLGGPKEPESLGDILESVGGIGVGLGPLASIVWEEWLKPYFPVSLLLLCALFARKQRATAALLLLGTLPYFFLALRIIVNNPERGAYLLPLLLPSSLLAFELASRRLTALCVIVSALLAVGQVRQHERDRGVDPDYGAGALEALGEEPAFILAWHDWEMDSLLLHGARGAHKPIHLPAFAILPRDQQRLAVLEYPKLLASRTVYLTREAERALADPWLSVSGPIILEQFRKVYRFEDVGAGPFRARRLVLKE